MRTTFHTSITFEVDVTAETRPREGGGQEVMYLDRVVTSGGINLLPHLSITDQIALAQEAEVAAAVDAGTAA